MAIFSSFFKSKCRDPLNYVTMCLKLGHTVNVQYQTNEYLLWALNGRVHWKKMAIPKKFIPVSSVLAMPAFPFFWPSLISFPRPPPSPSPSPAPTPSPSLSPPPPPSPSPSPPSFSSFFLPVFPAVLFVYPFSCASFQLHRSFFSFCFFSFSIIWFHCFSFFLFSFLLFFSFLDSTSLPVNFKTPC